MRTLTRGLALAVVSVLALTGCLKVEMNVTLEEDDTASGDFIFAMGQEIMAVAGEEGLDEMLNSEETIPGGVTERYESADEDGDGQPDFVGTQTTFEGLPLEEFDAAGDGLRIFRDGDDYVVSGAADDITEQTGGEELTGGATATMSVTFPGEVSEHNGELEGNTVTWNLLEHTGELQARGSSTADSGFPLWIILVIAAVVGIGAGIAGVLIVASKRKASQDNGFDSNPAVAPMTGGPTASVPSADTPVFTPADTAAPQDGATSAYDGVPADGTAPHDTVADDAPAATDEPTTSEPIAPERQDGDDEGTPRA